MESEIVEAESDESWEYDEKKIKCFSLCLPVYGDMHSNEGVYAKVCRLEKYIDILGALASENYSE